MFHQSGAGYIFLTSDLITSKSPNLHLRIETFYGELGKKKSGLHIWAPESKPPPPTKKLKLLMEYFVIGIAETSLHTGTLPSILTLLRLCMLLSGLDPSKKRSNGPFSTTTFHGFTLFPTKPQGSNPTCYSLEVFRPGGGEAVTPADRYDSNGRAETIINDSQFQVLPSLA